MHSFSEGGDGAVSAHDRFNLGYIWMISAVAALGGLLFGYDWVVIGGAKPFYEPYFHLTSEEQIGWANSCALLGCLLGSILSGAVSDRFGRKKLLIAAALLFGVSSVATGWSHQFNTFVAWRILGGVAIGIASNVSPTYIAEVAPARWRGRLVTLNQLTIVIGILAAQIVNLLIAGHIANGLSADAIRASWQGQFGWRWMFTAVAVPSLVFFVCAFLVPESPRWLIKSGARDKALHILRRIGGDAYAEDEVRAVESGLSRESRERGAVSELFRPAIMGLVLIGIGLAVLQQWSGTNVIFNYAEEIYRGAGYDLSGVMFNIVITGAINLVFTLVATATVDRLGRRTLMLWGAGALTVLHGLLGAAFYFGITGPVVLALTLAVIAAYAMSLAPVTWVLLSEIFPNRIRGLAMSVAVSALWIACFAVTYTFPILNRQLGAAGTFWCYGVFCLAGVIFIALTVPETRGRSLEEIEAQLTRRK
ncbi:sugar porter family MFS transporter [Asticcacaulis sp. EMRT-3]|uniref:sugar porter family MFS transporter n=1 Tax=Asticcacaulis sp. EMRT-3 TaxID=3040349 RepID=UPI0024AEB2DB|nr:sugar porter family MFS transporter [Asticcacaulis sp. EMRT-3]MDI7775094.1 sugar porter family MFS transporter [Asticcacaulis sp. EMRT-3]